MRRRNGKRKTGFGLLLLVVLAMCGLLTYNKGKAAEKEKDLQMKKLAYENDIDEQEARQRELEEERAYRQTKSYIEKLAREKLGLVMPDEILLRESEADAASGK